MQPGLRDRLFTPQRLDRLGAALRLDAGLVAQRLGADAGPAEAAALAEAEVLITSWGCPPLTQDVLDRAPRLRAVLHAAGSVRHHVTDACWARGIAVTSAADANAVPVAEYTLAAILFAGKRVLDLRDAYRARRAATDWSGLFPDIGNHRRRIGLVGASRVGRRVIELLRPFDVDVAVHDPYLSEAEAAELGVRAAGLDALCAESDVLSIHAPQLPATRHMIDAGRLALLRDGATVINTSRGSLIDQEALTAELVSGRLRAVVDVTEPEFLPAGSPLYELPNVLLTPHIAGSMGNELSRMAEATVQEAERYAAGEALRFAVHAEELDRVA
ncbi:hydroxyacid dehydrogenase [Mangrovactinospora gilvigrisea]|nr:hydroxyacid dehydrogenase [Mangrovactinospora gilvigrisea]